MSTDFTYSFCLFPDPPPPSRMKAPCLFHSSLSLLTSRVVPRNGGSQ